MPKPILTQSFIISLFYYLDGHLYWKKRPPTSAENKIFNSNFAGKKAGTLGQTGYIYIGININSKLWNYLGHRLIYKYFAGIEPVEIDHIDHRTNNNCINNLRNVGRQANCKNRSVSTRNSSGTVGLSWRKDSKKWRAYITHNQKRVYLGSFAFKQDAIDARQKANIKYGFHPNHGAT